MSEKEAPSNVIQFPSKKKEVEAKTPPVPGKTTPAPAQKPVTQSNKNKATLAGSVVAIILFTGAVNRFAFGQKNGNLELSSSSEITRAIASVEKVNWPRDAAWEKNLAETLASPQVRDVASIGIGHAATPEEKLRWGTLEEKYTIVYKSDAHVIDTIVLQDATTNPAYILDRNQFLREYGPLLENTFESAKLKSVEVGHDKTIESYTLYGKDKQPKSEARFELDIHKRLLSLKVEPVQI